MRFSPLLIFFLVLVPIFLVGLAARSFLPSSQDGGVPAALAERVHGAGVASAPRPEAGEAIVPGRRNERADGEDPDGTRASPVEGRPYRRPAGAATTPRPGDRAPAGSRDPGVRQRSGKVVGPENEPIPGSWVRVREHRNLVLGSGQRVPGPRDGQRVPVSESGVFLFEEEEGYVYELVIEAPDHVATMAVPETAVPLQVVLQPAGTLMGKVLDRGTNDVIVGAQIEVVQGPRTWALETGSDGRFEVSGLSKFLYVLRISHPAYAPLELHEAGPLPGGVISRTLDLSPGGRVEGFVTKDGFPVPGAKVRFFDRTSQVYVGSTFADGQGFYSAMVLAPGALLSAVVEGAPLPLAAAFVPTQESAQPAHPTRLDISLSDPIALLGSVVDTAGRPLIGAQVFLDVTMGGVLMESREASAGEDGGFQFPAVDPRASVRIAAFQPGFALGELEGVAGELATRTLAVELRGESLLEGRVQDELGRAIVGAYVEALQTQGGDGALGTTTDAQGRFRLTGLGPGTYDLQALKPGFDTAELPGIAIVEGELRSDLLLTLATL